MSATENAPVSKSPFWRFSVKFYAEPGVAQACIELQDRVGVDVNVLFFLLWCATQKRKLNSADVAKLDISFGAWRDLAVVPLRQLRRGLKSPPPVVSPDVAEAFRTRVKAVELEAERLQQEAMYAAAQSGRIGHEAHTKAEAVQGSIAAYQAYLQPFPPAPLDVILTAFAKFQPPV
jgi:uncharacterized protein (TIGR02444 family)